MSYRSDVPIDSQNVRGVSGDLIAMRENFVVLERVVVSGLNSLISGGANISGAVPVAQSSAANAQWHARKLSLASGDIVGITIAGITNGQVPVWSTANQQFEPGTPAAGGGGASGPMAIVTFASGQTQAPTQNVPELVSAGTVKRNTGGFTVGSGIFTVPTGSGYSEVQLFAQIRTTNLGNADRIYAGFRRHGVVGAITDTAGAKYAAVSATMRGLSSAGQQELQVFSPRIPVSGGDVFSLWVETNAVAAVISGSSAALAEDEGTSIWFSIEAFTTSGSSSAAAGAEYGAHIRAVSGAGTTQTLTTAISTVISGMTTTVRNVGGFTITHSGITVPTGSGYTHVELQGQITYTSNATGLRQMQFFQAGQTQLGIPGNPHGVVTQQQQAVVQASALTIVGGLSPRFPVSGGELFQLVGRQDSGGDLTVVHGFGTWFSLKAFKLTSGG